MKENALKKRVALKKRIAQETRVLPIGGEIKYKGFQKPSKKEADIIQEANELLEWSEKPTSMILNEYPLSKCYNPYHFRHLADISDYFKEALVIAKERIAMRIEEQSRSGRSDEKIDIAWVKEFLPDYSESYRQRRMDFVSAKITAQSGAPTAEEYHEITKRMFESVKDIKKDN